MSNYGKSVTFVLNAEGGLVNASSDHGGMTNFGISSKQYPDLDIANLTRRQAMDIYFRDYWTPGQCEVMSWPVDCVHLDASVNSGIKQSTRFLQEAANVPVDGQLGPITLSAIREMDPAALAYQAIQARRVFFNRIAVNDQVKFLAGWLKRCDDLEAFIK